MEKDDLVHDMEAVSPRSFQDGLPVSQERILKFELQLYKLKDSEYLLDVQVGSPCSSRCSTPWPNIPISSCCKQCTCLGISHRLQILCMGSHCLSQLFPSHLQ